MADISRMTVKMPRIRIAIVGVVARILNPFVRSEEAGERIGNAMLAWIKRGLRIYVNGERIR